MKRFKVGTPTKKTGGLLVVAAVATALLGVGGMSAAYAADDAWTPQSTKTYFAIDCQQPGGLPVLIEGTENVADGESISNPLIDGQPPVGDGELRAAAGVHTYSYVVTNLNSTTDPKESVTLTGSFTVDVCHPSASLSITATPNDDGTTRSISVSGSVTVENIPDGSTVKVVTTASSGATSTTTVNGADFATTLTGTFPDGDVSVSSQVYVNDAAVGSPAGASVTFQPKAVEPKAPLFDAHLNGILNDNNESEVYYVVTVDHGDAEGTLTVLITHEEKGVTKTDATLEFPGDTETMRGTFPMDVCGAIGFAATFKGSPVGQTYTVNVPCPKTDDGNTGGNSGNHNGGTSNGNHNGGSDTNGTTNGTDTNGSQVSDTSNTNAVPDGKTDGFDLQGGGVSPLVLTGGAFAGALLIAIGFVAYARRRSTVEE